MSAVPLAEFQHAFAQGLRAGADAQREGILAQPGFAVYRNTVAKACIDALAANFPCVARLVGEAWFRAAAARYVRRNPVRDPCLLHYGERFPDFLADFEPARALPYLPAVARLDRMRTESHAARDAAPLLPADLASHTPLQLGARVLGMHPAARWAWFDEVPAFSIWCANNAGSGAPGKLEWMGEGALLTRPLDVVRWTRLDDGGVAFLDACRERATLAEAAAAASARRADTDLSALIATLLQAGAFTDVN